MFVHLATLKERKLLPFGRQGKTFRCIDNSWVLCIDKLSSIFSGGSFFTRTFHYWNEWGFLSEVMLYGRLSGNFTCKLWKLHLISCNWMVLAVKYTILHIFIGYNRISMPNGFFNGSWWLPLGVGVVQKDIFLCRSPFSTAGKATSDPATIFRNHFADVITSSFLVFKLRNIASQNKLFARQW